MKLSGESQAELIKYALIGGAVLLVAWYVTKKGGQAYDAIKGALAAPGIWVDQNIIAPVEQHVADSRQQDLTRLNDFSQSPYDRMIDQGIPL